MKYIAIIVLALSLSVCSTAKAPVEGPFTVNLNSPRFSAGVIEAYFDKMLNISGIRKVNVTVDYYPLEDAVCLQYRIEFMTFYHFFDREGRAAYLKALERYKEDYENRVLNTTGGKKTRKQYGRIDSYLIWQAAAYTVRARAHADVDLGYDIKKISKNRASFFTVYRRETFYAHEMAQKDRRIAPNAPMYLTRSQADELAELFDQDFLANLITDPIRKKGDNIIDSY